MFFDWLSMCSALNVMRLSDWTILYHMTRAPHPRGRHHHHNRRLSIRRTGPADDQAPLVGCTSPAFCRPPAVALCAAPWVSSGRSSSWTCTCASVPSCTHSPPDPTRAWSCSTPANWTLPTVIQKNMTHIKLWASHWKQTEDYRHQTVHKTTLCSDIFAPC